jgi:hypothetical protein
MLKHLKYIIFIFTFLCLATCLLDCTGSDSQMEKVIVRSFYHWKTDFELSEDQSDFLSDLKVEEIYLHLFDVVWDGVEATPTAITELKHTPTQKIKPVVYLTTDVFSNLDSLGVLRLAEQVSQKIKAIMQERAYGEVQFDCDWFPSVKDNYFSFLEEIKKYFPDQVISSTVRLYQYKYPDLAGVPPVDKGVLMYYNMGGITDFDESNSILNNKTGFQYLGFGEYPLPLDIALPNFEWNTVFRSGEFMRLSTDFQSASFTNTDLFKKVGVNKYAIKLDTVIADFYYRFGDVIRYEDCPKLELEVAAKELVKEINQDSTSVIFYDLREHTKEDYEKLDAVYSIFE